MDMYHTERAAIQKQIRHKKTKDLTTTKQNVSESKCLATKNHCSLLGPTETVSLYNKQYEFAVLYLFFCRAVHKTNIKELLHFVEI